jgi:hypothetical protein
MIWFSASTHVFDILTSQGTGGLTETNKAQEEDDHGFNDATYQPIKPGWG